MSITFLYIILQDYLAYVILIFIIILSTLYFYLSSKTHSRTPSYPVVYEPFIKDIENQQVPSFYPEHIPNEIRETGFIQFLRKKHLECGLIVTDLPLMNTISVIDPKAIRSILNIRDRTKDLYQFLEPIWGKDNLQVFSAGRAKMYRKFFDPALAVDVIIDKFDDIRNFGVEMIDRWEKNIALRHENVVRMQDQSLEFSLKAATKILFSADLPRDLDSRAYRKTYDDVISGLFDKQFGAISDLRDERLQTSTKYLFKVLCILINEKKRNITDVINKGKSDPMLSSKKDLLDLLISEKDPETGGKFDDEKIRNMVSMFLTFGYLTTGVAISWTIFCITQDRVAQTKIQNEIDHVLEGRLPSYNDLPNLNYLTQAINESLRICPPTPFISRYLAKNMNLQTSDKPLKLTAGTTILCPITSIHEEEHNFRDPKNLDPSQFQIKTPFSHCPFGFGERICPAEKLAMTEIKLMVCLIMQRFHVELAMPLNKVSRDEKFILMARNDIYIKLVSRKDVE